MSKRRSTKITPQEDAQSVGFLVLFGGFFAAYLAVEATLATRPHPIHWLVAGAVAVAVGGLGYGLTFWRLTRRR